jgi:hypothetical protein
MEHDVLRPEWHVQALRAPVFAGAVILTLALGIGPTPSSSVPWTPSFCAMLPLRIRIA